MARIIVKERGYETRNFPIVPGSIFAGRAKENTVVIRNRYASGRHCELTYANGMCTVTDLNSTNGLFVNGAKVDNITLVDGDKILVGTALLIYIADEDAVHVDKLIELLDSGSPDERELAASLLGQFGSRSEAKRLAAALQDDPDARVKASAAEALGFVGDSKFIGALLAYFDTPDTNIRNSVVRSIVRISDDKTVDGVASYLKHQDSKIRVLAAHTMGRMQNRRGVKPLIKALDDEAFAVREAAVKALGDLGDRQALQALLRAADDPLRCPQMWVIEALGKLKSAKALPVIMKAMHDYDPEVREAAANALGGLREPEAIPELIKALDDQDANVRKAVAVSLEKMRKHLEVEHKLGDAKGNEAETIDISSFGDSEDDISSSSPRFGEDRAKWEQWWSEKGESQ